MTGKDGGPAFPTTDDVLGGPSPSQGMSLRDYFAAAAMEQMSRWHGLHQGSHADIARDCYAFADAMLTARER